MFGPSPFDAAIGGGGGGGNPPPPPARPSRPTSYSPADGPPPHTAPRPAGADTSALMGPEQEDNPGAMTPKARVIAACAMYMQATNILATELPAVMQAFPQLIPTIQQICQTAPAAMDEMARLPNPMSMFSAIGSAMGVPGGGAGGAGSPSPSPILTNPATAAGMPAGMGM